MSQSKKLIEGIVVFLSLIGLGIVVYDLSKRDDKLIMGEANLTVPKSVIPFELQERCHTETMFDINGKSGIACWSWTDDGDLIQSFRYCGDDTKGLSEKTKTKFEELCRFLKHGTPKAGVKKHSY